MAERIFHTTTLTERTELTADVLQFRFAKPEGFTFIPGQFVQFRIPEGNNYVFRSYSISSIPTDPYVEFCIKLVANGKGSAFFAGLMNGQSVQFSQALGLFIVKPEHSPRKICIATGVGMAPIMGLVRSLASTHDTVQVLFGVRTEQDFFWLDRLDALQKTAPYFRYSTTVSQPNGLWHGKTGRVTAHIEPVDSTAEYYMCGSLEMIKDVRAILNTAGVAAKQIHFEIF